LWRRQQRRRVVAIAVAAAINAELALFPLAQAELLQIVKAFVVR
jgi:hypothetical protein